MNDPQKRFIIDSKDAGQRLDIFLSKVSGFSRSKIGRLLDDGFIMVDNNLPKKAGEKVKTGSVITIFEIEDVEESNKKNNFSLDIFDIPILLETDDYLIINKPAGLLVHPTKVCETGTLVEFLLARYPNLIAIGDGPERPGIVHRLDREASGVLVIAKTKAMFAALKKQFQLRQVEKEYTVLVHNPIEAEEGVIDFLIDRGVDGKMVARPKTDPLNLASVPHMQKGKSAITEFLVRQRFLHYTLLSVKTHTGRTHQIRVHFFAYNHPVVGDMLYSQKKFNKYNQGINRLFLHAVRLRFTDLSGQFIEAIAPLPFELQTFLDNLRL